VAPRKYAVEEVTDPAEVTRFNAQYEQMRRNADWLEAHWDDVLPQAHGKFLAVAGQEAFLGDSADEAWAWTATAHAEDLGALVQYVLPPGGPRFYANRR
jgi:hypothetical protein